MVSKYTQKSELTQQILDKLPGIQFPLEKSMRMWWANPEGGWLLTDQGQYIFDKLKIKGHDFTIKYRSAKFYLMADRLLSSPYYIKRYTLTIYGSKEATAIVLTGGDIQQYLERYC